MTRTMPLPGSNVGWPKQTSASGSAYERTNGPEAKREAIQGADALFQSCSFCDIPVPAIRLSLESSTPGTCAAASLVAKGQRQQLGNMVHEVNLQLLPYFFGNLAPIRCILVRQQDLLDSKTSRGQNLLLDTP